MIIFTLLDQTLHTLMIPMIPYAGSHLHVVESHMLFGLAKSSQQKLFLLRIRPPRIHNILYIDETRCIQAFVISIMYYYLTTVDKHEYIDTSAYRYVHIICILCSIRYIFIRVIYIYVSIQYQVDRQTDRQMYRLYRTKAHQCIKPICRRFGISDKFFVLASDAVQTVVMEIVPLVKKGRDST